MATEEEVNQAKKIIRDILKDGPYSFNFIAKAVSGKMSKEVFNMAFSFLFINDEITMCIDPYAPLRNVLSKKNPNYPFPYAWRLAPKCSQGG